MPRGLRGTTVPPGGIENRFKSLPKPKVNQQTDFQLVTFLREQALSKRTEAINEFDQLLRQGLVDEATKLELASNRLIDLVDYLDQGALKRELRIEPSEA